MQKSREKKKVLQLAHGYSAPFGDVARQYVALFDGEEQAEGSLSAEGSWQVTTIFLKGQASEQVKKQVGGHSVQFWDVPQRQLRGLKLGLIWRLWKLLRKEHYVLLIAHRSKAIYLSMLASRFLPDVQVMAVIHAYGRFSRFSRKILLRVFAGSLKIIGVSDAICRDIRTSLPFFPAERVLTLYNHVPIDTMQSRMLYPNAARTALNLPKTGRLLVNIGRLHPDKDQQTLLKALAVLADQYHEPVYLVLIGEGRLRQQLEQQAQALHIHERVIFDGRVQDAFCYLPAFDAFVLSSDHEPFGMVLLEAMLAGIPVISSDTGGAPEVVANTGWLFPQGNADILANKMQQVLELEEQQKQSRKEAMFQRVQEYFSDEAVREVFAQIYS